MWITFNLALIIHANASQNTLFREKSPNQICFFVQLMACFMKIYCRFVITVLYLINDIISLEVGWDIISAAVLTIMAVNPSIYQPKSQFFNVSDHSRVLIHLLNTCIFVHVMGLLISIHQKTSKLSGKQEICFNLWKILFFTYDCRKRFKL